MFDRETTSLMGLPVSIHDDDIDCPLPAFGGSTQRAAALDMNVKLCRVLAKINKSQPGPASLDCSRANRRQDSTVEVAACTPNTSLAQERSSKPSQMWQPISRHLSLYDRAKT